jgi:hypothetical protein
VRSAWTGDRTALIRLLTDAERHASHLGDAVAERDARIAALARDLEQAHTGSAELRRALKREALARAESQRAAADTRTALAALLGSRSWRLTAPLRGLANRARARKGR